MLSAALYNRLRKQTQHLRAWAAPRYYRLHALGANLSRAGAKPILETIRGDDPNAGSDRIAVFVHYDGKGQVDDYVVTYLQGLNAAGFRIWFMSNTPRLGPESLARVTPLVARVHRRNNFGFDFGAYKDGILSVFETDTPRQLVLCNDSVYGPLQPLATVLALATSEGADAWGMTESYEIRYHLQSYFMLFNKRAIEHPSFLKFWREAPYVDARGWLIHHGEIGLSQALIGAGLNMRALFPIDELRLHLANRIAKFENADPAENKPSTIGQRAQEFREHIAGSVESGIPLNPTHFFWDVLIEDCKFPFIKRDLLQLNPAGVAGLIHWRQTIKRVSGYDVELIRRHLNPRLKNRII